MRIIQAMAALLLVIFAEVSIQAQTTTGTVFGDVTDSSGAIVNGAQVTITARASGLVRETKTTNAGSYELAGLPPAEYELSVEFEQFSPITRRGVVVPIQGRIKIDFRLEVGRISESLTVTDSGAVVHPGEHAIQTVVDNRLIRELPLKTRDFMDLALLTPGIVLDQSSIRNGSTDSISFFGLEEAYKTVWLEGVDFNDEATTGGTNISPATRTRLGLETIQEFQVMATGYSAEFGRSGAGAVNVILKSGGNSVHGSAFYFLRDDSFDKPAFQISNGVAKPASNVPPFRRQQFGGTIGGPIFRDRAFYFASIERPTARESSQVLIPASVKSFVDSLQMGYDTRSVVPRTREQVNATGKISVNVNRSNRLDATYLYDDDNDQNKNIGGSVAADRGFDDLNSSYFATANLTSIIRPALVNELRVNRSIQRLFRTIPASSHFLPGLDFPTVRIGTDGAASPQGRVQRNWIVANTTSYHSGRHSLKWGGEINIVRAPVITNENFNGNYRFPRDTAPFVPDRYTAGFNLQFARGESPSASYTLLQRDMNMYALFANDTWRIRQRFTLNLGLRYDVRVLRGDLGGPDAFKQSGFSREHPEDVWLNVALGKAGSIGVQPWRPVPNDTLDLSPRVGFSWDVTGDGRKLIRGSYGWFHDRITSLSLRSAVNSYNGLNIQSVEVANPTFFPSVPNSAALPAAAISVSGVPSPTGSTPYTLQSNLGFAYALSPNTAVSADFTHMLGLNFQMIRNVNAPLPLSLTGGTRVCPFGEALRAKGMPECLQMQIQNDQSNRIHLNALSLHLERRFAKRVGFNASYTLGKVESWSTGTFGTLPTNAYSKFNALDFGPYDNDVRHRFTGNLTYQLPLNFNVATIVMANSAPPYNQTTGIDDNLDFVINDRPQGVRFNSLRADKFFTTDLRLSKKISLGESRSVELMWEMFNLFNTANLTDYNGNQRASTFQQPRAALPPFQAQLGARLQW
jgi:carboxypeptidase family protein/TonB-dependent receptor-like protein